jgi:parvulin-like peptidyl-prolyl isomerase
VGGPLESSYGLHVVRVRERRRAPVDVTGVRAKAREDWLADRKQAVEQSLAAALRDRYEVVREDAEKAPL